MAQCEHCGKEIREGFKRCAECMRLYGAKEVDNRKRFLRLFLFSICALLCIVLSGVIISNALDGSLGSTSQQEVMIYCPEIEVCPTWEEPWGDGVTPIRKKEVGHGQICKVEDTTYYAGYMWYDVTCADGWGWIDENFIRQR